MILLEGVEAILYDFDFDTVTDVEIYKAFVTKGKETDALNGSYPELVELLGYEATLKLYKYFRGCKIDCPKFLYRQDYIVELAAHVPDKRMRAKIAIASGYTANRLEALIVQRKKNGNGNGDVQDEAAETPEPAAQPKIKKQNQNSK